MELKEKLQLFLKQKREERNELFNPRKDVETVHERAKFYCGVIDGIEEILESY